MLYCAYILYVVTGNLVESSDDLSLKLLTENDSTVETLVKAVSRGRGNIYPIKLNFHLCQDVIVHHVYVHRNYTHPAAVYLVKPSMYSSHNAVGSDHVWM